VEAQFTGAEIIPKLPPDKQCRTIKPVAKQPAAASGQYDGG
jgi:hypothetical protein